MEIRFGCGKGLVTCNVTAFPLAVSLLVKPILMAISFMADVDDFPFLSSPQRVMSISSPDFFAHSVNR